MSVRVRALIRAMLRCALSRPEGLEGEPQMRDPGYGFGAKPGCAVGVPLPNADNRLVIGSGICLDAEGK